MRLRTQVTNLTSGALDPRMRARVDTAHYSNGAKTIKNALIHPHGGAYRRPSLEFMDDMGTLASLGGVVNIEFEFNTEQTYTLVASNTSIEVFKDGVSQTTITTPYATADLPLLTWTQSADTLILFHPDYEPRVVTRTSHTSWTIATWGATNIPKFAFSLSVSNPSTTLTPSATTGNVTLTAGAATFAATDVGAYVYGNGGEARITKYLSTTKVEAVVLLDFINTSAIPSGTWEFEQGYEDVWSATRGWPRSGTFHNNRLFIGGSKERPSTLWGSKIGDFFDFDIGSVRNDDAFSYTLDTDQVNEIRFIVSAETLQVFTSGGAFAVPELTEGITPENIRFVRQDTKGTEQASPIFADGSTMFIQKNADVVREFLYDSVRQKYEAVPVSLLSGHLINSPTQLCHQPPHAFNDSDLVYTINSDGTWSVLNSLRRQEITAWVEGDTPEGTVLSASFDGNYTYVSVVRNVGGVDKVYLERFNFAKMLDSSLTIDNGTPTTAWSGLSHLEGLDVYVYGDPQADGTGYVEGPHTVTSGAITTDYSYTEAEIGLFWVPEVELEPVERELPDGSMSGEIRRIVSATVRYNDTTNIVVNGSLVPLRRFGQPIFDGPLPLSTDDKKIRILGYSRNPTVTVTQDAPGPFHLLAVVMEVQIK